MSSSHQDPVTSADAHELDASHDDAGPAGGAGPDLHAADVDARSPVTPGHVDPALADQDEPDAKDLHDPHPAAVAAHDVAARAVGHGQDQHDAHDPSAESAAWVLAPLLIGVVIAVVLVLWLGFGSSA